MQAIHTTTIYWLVALSVLMSVKACYAAFGFAERMAKSRGLVYFGWLSCGALTLGLGIWSMHYLGMLSLRLPIEVVYYVPEVLRSLVVAVLACAAVLMVVSTPELTGLRLRAGAVLMGSGIAAMHYTGMQAMRAGAIGHQRPAVVLLALLMAMGFSWLALWMGFVGWSRGENLEWVRVKAALVMGFGIAAMHYTAIWAITFVPCSVPYSVQNTVRATDLSVAAAMVITALVLLGAMIGTRLDRRSYERVSRERDRLSGASDNSMDALVICESVRSQGGEIFDFKLTYLNKNVSKLVSIPQGLLMGARMCEVLPVSRTLGLFARFKEVVRTGEPMLHEFAISDRDVRSAWIRVHAVKLGDGVSITASDITDRKRKEEEMLYLAHHDPLTGLVNRSLLHDRIEQAIERARRYGGKVGVFLINLDEFKQVNDRLGHAAGDSVLMVAASRLQSVVRATDSVIRLGGDEFVVVVLDVHCADDIEVCGEKIVEAIGEPMHVGGHYIDVTCSLGIAVYPDSGQSAGALLSKADGAMYLAKQDGKGRLALCASA